MTNESENQPEQVRHFFYQPARTSVREITGFKVPISPASAKSSLPRKTPIDPLNVVMAVLAIILILTGTSWFFGYGIYATSFVLLLLFVAYIKAPRRTFPTAAQVAEGTNLKGKVALVTGATSGIGVETARILAMQGAKVYIAARDVEKMERTTAELTKSIPQGSDMEWLECNLADLNSVQACAQRFLQEESRLDILIHNAGIMALPKRTGTKQGLESQVAVCHVGHFYLTQLLLPALENATTPSNPSRVVSLSSVGYRNHNITELLKSPHLETAPYVPFVAYGNAKCCNLLFAQEFHQRHYLSKHIAAFSVSPGGIFTGLQAYVHPWTMFKWTIVAPFLFKSIEQGAATTLVCACTADPDSDGGQCFDNCKATDFVAKVQSEAGVDVGSRLWTSTEELLKDRGFDCSPK